MNTRALWNEWTLVVAVCASQGIYAQGSPPPTVVPAATGAKPAGLSTPVPSDSLVSWIAPDGVDGCAWHLGDPAAGTDITVASIRVPWHGARLVRSAAGDILLRRYGTPNVDSALVNLDEGRVTRVPPPPSAKLVTTEVRFDASGGLIAEAAAPRRFDPDDGLPPTSRWSFGSTGWKATTERATDSGTDLVEQARTHQQKTTRADDLDLARLRADGIDPSPTRNTWDTLHTPHGTFFASRLFEPLPGSTTSGRVWYDGRFLFCPKGVPCVTVATLSKCGGVSISLRGRFAIVQLGCDGPDETHGLFRSELWDLQASHRIWSLDGTGHVWFWPS